MPVMENRCHFPFKDTSAIFSDAEPNSEPQECAGRALGMILSQTSAIKHPRQDPDSELHDPKTDALWLVVFV